MQNRPTIRSVLEHDYVRTSGPGASNTQEAKNVVNEYWREDIPGRRVVEFGTLLSSLTPSSCQSSSMGPVALAERTAFGELQKGLGYLYVRCEVPDRGYVDRVSYGKTHQCHMKEKRMPCFVFNTKLGAGIKSFYILFHCTLGKTSNYTVFILK